MSTNKDLVAQAVAAIPLWMAFLDQKEAEQDALLDEMQGRGKTSLMQKATSLLKKPEKPVEQVQSDQSDQSDQLEQMRWAPTETEGQEESERPLSEEEEKEENQIRSMF